jgi:hypothetical protein
MRRLSEQRGAAGLRLQRQSANAADNFVCPCGDRHRSREERRIALQTRDFSNVLDARQNSANRSPARRTLARPELFRQAIEEFCVHAFRLYAVRFEAEHFCLEIDGKYIHDASHLVSFLLVKSSDTEIRIPSRDRVLGRRYTKASV